MDTALPSARAWSYFPNQAGETGRTGLRDEPRSE